MKKLTFIFIILTILINPVFPDLTLPNSFKFETQEDFDQYEEKIIECINWFFAVPLSEEPEFRANLKAFVLIWLTENPKITLVINEDILGPVLKDEGYENNPDLVFSYLIGMALYVLEEKKEIFDPVEVQYAGIMSMLLLFQKNKEILYGSKGLEAYLILHDSKELHNWIENTLKESEEE